MNPAVKMHPAARRLNYLPDVFEVLQGECVSNAARHRSGPQQLSSGLMGVR